MRQITQPYKSDIIIMDALSLLLNVIFENLFLTYSHGFRKDKGQKPSSLMSKHGKRLIDL